MSDIKRILIGLGMLWVFLVIGGALLAELFGTGNPLAGGTTGFLGILTTTSNFAEYGGIVGAVANFIPLVVGLAFVLPVLAAIGLGGYALWNKARNGRNM